MCICGVGRFGSSYRCAWRRGSIFEDRSSGMVRTWFLRYGSRHTSRHGGGLSSPCVLVQKIFGRKHVRELLKEALTSAFSIEETPTVRLPDCLLHTRAACQRHHRLTGISIILHVIYILMLKDSQPLRLAPTKFCSHERARLHSHRIFQAVFQLWNRIQGVPALPLLMLFAQDHAQ